MSTLCVTTAAVSDGASVSRVLRCEDGGFILLDAAAADSDPGGYDPGDLIVACAHCVIERHPAVAPGMDVARRAGAARLVGGDWIEEG